MKSRDIIGILLCAAAIVCFVVCVIRRGEGSEALLPLGFAFIAVGTYTNIRLEMF